MADDAGSVLIPQLLRTARALRRASESVLLPDGKPLPKHRYPQSQLLAVLCLAHLEGWTYQEATEYLRKYQQLRRELGIRQIPHFTTFQKCRAKLSEATFQEVLRQVACLSSSIGEARGEAVQTVAIHFPLKFGQTLRFLREARGLGQVGLASRANFSQSYVSQLETGRRRPSTAAHVQQLARGLELDAGIAIILLTVAGFAPTDTEMVQLQQDESTTPDLLGEIILRLMARSTRGEPILKDILRRLSLWDTYEEALNASQNDSIKAVQLCRKILTSERNNALFAKAADLCLRLETNKREGKSI